MSPFVSVTWAVHDTFMLKTSEIITKARAIGFDDVVVAPVEPVGAGWYAPHAERVKDWVAQGEHADMKWMEARLGERVVPASLLPNVCSSIVLWMNHRTRQPARPAGQIGKVAAYAWGRDYHNVVRKAVRKLERWMFEVEPALKRYISIDTGAVLERSFGERGALGWIGRSTMLIHQELGTFGSIAVIFVAHPLEPSSIQGHPNRCGRCTDCISACPTNALTDGRLDARLCISYWTIEHRGMIPTDMRPMLGEWVFGCDICQDVCPWNNKAPDADHAIWKPKPDHVWPDLIAWLEQSSEALHAQLLGSPLRRAGGAGLRRNALVVLANMEQHNALPTIKRLAASDPDPIIRATAVWAARQLGDASVISVALKDPDPRVRGEAN